MEFFFIVVDIFTTWQGSWAFSHRSQQQWGARHCHLGKCRCPERWRATWETTNTIIRELPPSPLHWLSWVNILHHQHILHNQHIIISVIWQARLSPGTQLALGSGGLQVAAALLISKAQHLSGEELPVMEHADNQCSKLICTLTTFISCHNEFVHCWMTTLTRVLSLQKFTWIKIKSSPG